jgi:hypothetical protein
LFDQDFNRIGRIAFGGRIKHTSCLDISDEAIDINVSFSDTKCLYHAAEGDPIYPVKFLSYM